MTSRVGVTVLRIGVMGSVTVLAGCALWLPAAPEPKREIPAVVVAAATTLTTEAAAELEIARRQIKAARVERRLWTSALQTLQSAERAAAVFDSAEVVRLSREVVAICERSALQARLPAVTW